jgi:hypothetical protein
MRSPHPDDASLCKLDAQHVTCFGVAFDLFACCLHGGRDMRSNYVIKFFVVLLYYYINELLLFAWVRMEGVRTGSEGMACALCGDPHEGLRLCRIGKRKP